MGSLIFLTQTLVSRSCLTSRAAFTAMSMAEASFRRLTHKRTTRTISLHCSALVITLALLSS